jgi:NAD(P)-dependent dehydrogenase (short-subunit alcohol dehydrogenase family)
MNGQTGGMIKTGTRVLVTAGGSGIGHAIAKAFLDHGARVHICDVSDAMLSEGLATLAGATGTLADVADPSDVDRLFDDAEAELGGLDVLVNNAGIAGPTATVENISPEDWTRTIAINLTGSFLCCRRGVPLLKNAGGGSVINISSVAGRLGYPLRTPYASSKWAIVGLTESLAMELGPSNIRVNALLPGVVAGERIRRVISARAEAEGVGYEEMEQNYLNLVSMRRMVTAEDVANMAIFLVSALGCNVSGQAISVCGNVEVLR